MGEKEKVSIGFRIFSIATEIIIVLSVLFLAWIIDRLFIAPLFITAIYLVRKKIHTKFNILLFPTILTRIVFSIAICIVGVYISIQSNISLTSGVVVGSVFATMSLHLREAIDARSRKDRKEMLISKCAEKGYSEFKTQIAIMFFIENKKPKEVWEWICTTRPLAMSWDTVRNLKCKMKKDLF